jgi:hypothetical protein
VCRNLSTAAVRSCGPRSAAFVLWVVKFAVITARDGSFEPLEGFVYAAGIAGILVGALGLAALVTGRASGWHRLVVFPLAFALPILLSVIVLDALIKPAIGTTNQGLDEESGILFSALLWIAIGIILRKASSRSGDEGQRQTPPPD